MVGLLHTSPGGYSSQIPDLRAAAKLEPSNTSVAQELTKVTDTLKRKTVSKVISKFNKRIILLMYF